jgi:hypothetical protein
MTAANQLLCIRNQHIFLLVERDFKLYDLLFNPGSAPNVISIINNDPNAQGLGGNTFPAALVM